MGFGTTLSSFQNISTSSQDYFRAFQRFYDAITAMRSTSICSDFSSRCFLASSSGPKNFSFLGEEILQCHDDNDVRKLFQALLWQQAANCRDMNDWESSITWYEISRPFFGTDDVTNIAKLLRNKCSCFLELGQVAQVILMTSYFINDVII